MFAFHEKPKGVYWVGTRGGGLNRLTFEGTDWQNPSYQHIMHDSENPNSLSDNYVWSITSDNRPFLWVGTDKGVNKITLNDAGEPMDFQHVQYEKNNPNSLSSNLIGPIHIQDPHTIWVGTAENGLNKLDFADPVTMNQPTVTRYHTSDGLPDEVIYGIIPDDRGYLWLSTNNGISRFDPNFKKIDGQSSQDAFKISLKRMD